METMIFLATEHNQRDHSTKLLRLGHNPRFSSTRQRRRRRRRRSIPMMISIRPVHNDDLMNVPMDATYEVMEGGTPRADTILPPDIGIKSKRGGQSGGAELTVDGLFYIIWYYLTNSNNKM